MKNLLHISQANYADLNNKNINIWEWYFCVNCNNEQPHILESIEHKTCNNCGLI